MIQGNYNKTLRTNLIDVLVEKFSSEMGGGVNLLIGKKNASTVF